jgi:hypothetical protein
VDIIWSGIPSLDPVRSGNALFGRVRKLRIPGVVLSEQRLRYCHQADVGVL